MRRIAALDVLRGVAILGTLGANVWIFTDPAGLVGCLVRAGLLLLDGALHDVLVAEFDVLMGYAVTGVVVAHLLARSERAQRAWLVAAAAVHLALLTGVVTLLVLFPAPPRRGPVEPDPYADGTWWDLVAFRLDNAGLFRAEPVFLLAMGVALFLLGARLLRAGVLDDGGRHLRRRLMLLGAVALPVDLGLNVLGGDAGVVAARCGTAPLVSLGLLAGVTALLRARPHLGWTSRRLTEVGRAALSCYVLQNVLASALCYGWGLGLAQRLDPAARVPATAGVWLVVAAAVVLAAHLWLRRSDRGPLEAVWAASYRALARERPTTGSITSPA